MKIDNEAEQMSRKNDRQPTICGDCARARRLHDGKLFCGEHMSLREEYDSCDSGVTRHHERELNDDIVKDLIKITEKIENLIKELLRYTANMGTWQRKLRVKLDPGAFKPERAHSTDAGLDLKAMHEKDVPAHGSTLFRTGVHVQLPPGTAGVLISKSGLNVNHGITSTGVIDEGYTGEIMVKLYNNSNEPYWVRPGDKISQLVIVPVLYLEPEIVEEFDSHSERGIRGFGSTGR